MSNNIVFPCDKEQMIGTRDDVLKKLRELANPSCTRCHGLGHLGYISKKIPLRNGRTINQRSYVHCPKCVEKKL